MKKFTKTLSMVLLIAMCMSMFAGNAFAVDEHTCSLHAGESQVKHVEAKAATCTENGNIEYWVCNYTGCPHCYKDAALTQKIETPEELVVPAAHTWEDVAATTATCKDDGIGAHRKCSACGTLDRAPDVTAANPAAHKWGDWVVTVKPTYVSEGTKVRTCSVCNGTETGTVEMLQQEFAVTQFNGAKSYAYSDGASFGYTSVGGKVDKVTANDQVIDFSTNTAGTEVYISSTAVSGFKGPTINLMFYYGTKTSSGLSITKSENLTNGNLKVDGFEQIGLTQGSTEAVTIQTSDPDASNVKLYSFDDDVYVVMDSNDYDFEYIGNGMYTYTFRASFLNTLEPGTYFVRCTFGDGQYQSAGKLIINKNGTTNGLSSSLVFSNSTVSDKEFKYVSGGITPKLYCELFRVSNNLLYSTDGYSWKNVSVYDFYIELSNGKATPYAWIKTSFLEKLPASSNVYFKVVVPASDRGTSVDAESNQIKITTGHTLAPVDTNKHVINSSKNLKFVCSDVISEVYVGGQNLAKTDPDAFKVSADGKYVTLYASFLNDRTAGSTYTLSVLTKSGEKLSTTFQILTTAQASASPRTGDDSNIALWSAFLLMSGAAVVAVLPRLKKED